MSIESRSFLPGQTACSLGVFLENAVPLNDIMLPLEFRSQTGSAYVATTVTIDLPPNGRLSIKQGGPSAPNCEGFEQVARRYAVPSGQTCSGPVSSTYAQASAVFDFVSPDCLRFYRACYSGEALNDSVPLPPGSDQAGTANASLVLVFDVDDYTGTFVIDTTCVTPANHLLFVHNDHGNVLAYTPSFYAATITIECGPCRCHADPNCDGVVNVLDVQLTINRALRGAVLPCEPYVVGGNASLDGPTDVDCSGQTDILDVVKSIEVAFRAGDPATEFCDPCP